MKYERFHDTVLPKVGFGTWTVGGEANAEPDKDDFWKAVLQSALELGYTHFDTAEYYAAGHTEELLGKVVREIGVQREKLFVTSKVSPEHLGYQDVMESCERSLQRLGMDYIDLYLIHWPNPKIKLEESFKGLNELVRAGKVKHLGVSNFKLKLLVEACSFSETPILTNQVRYSLPDQTYKENGVLEYCQQNNILLTAYTPVKFRNLKVNSTIQKIAEAHKATPCQIALAWVISHDNVITIPMSCNPLHQKENLEAADIELSYEDMEKLNNLYKR